MVRGGAKPYGTMCDKWKLDRRRDLPGRLGYRFSGVVPYIEIMLILVFSNMRLIPRRA